MGKVLTENPFEVLPKGFMPICKDTYELAIKLMGEKNIGFKTKEEDIETIIVHNKTPVMKKIDIDKNSHVYGIKRGFYYGALGF